LFFPKNILLQTPNSEPPLAVCALQVSDFIHKTNNLVLLVADSLHGEEHPKQDVMDHHCSHLIMVWFAKANGRNMVYVSF
jgi:hypothetical protein